MLKMQCYKTALPVLDALCGAVAIITLVRLFNIVWGATIPSYQPALFLLLMFFLSWNKMVIVYDGQVRTWYQHKLLSFIQLPRTNITYSKFLKLELKPSTFGYIDWVVSDDKGPHTLLSTGKIS